jgi:hypothetical protein
MIPKSGYRFSDKIMLKQHLPNMVALIRRLKRLLRLAALAVAVLAAPAQADDLDDFNRAVEAAMSHHRVALGYLRTENVDLAMLELEAMREAWGKASALPRPAIYRDNPRFTETMLDVNVRIVGVFLVLDMGRIDVARASLSTIRHSLAAMRRASKAEVLADCILDANTAMDVLYAADGKPAEAATPAENYTQILQRCDGMAPPGIRNHADFRRLIDGALASLAQIPKAIETRDAALLHRLLIELRSFDNLLAFRFG